MKIHFLGTCSGTEPMPGMHHCSFILTVNDVNYWFDAGESCAYTAFTSGVDVMKTKAIFVSHPHVDHIGGLANLLACIRKMTAFKKTLINNNTLQIYFPDLDVLQAVKTVCGALNTFTIEEHRIREGVIFEDENIKVTTIHNDHMGEFEDPEDWRSFSFLVEAEGKRLIFSGDVRSPMELDRLGAEGADLLVMETGHHKPQDVCEYAVSRKLKNLRFNHHGRVILYERPAIERMVAEYSVKGAMSIKICYDNMIEEF